MLPVETLLVVLRSYPVGNSGKRKSRRCCNTTHPVLVHFEDLTALTLRERVLGTPRETRRDERRTVPDGGATLVLEDSPKLALQERVSGRVQVDAEAGVEGVIEHGTEERRTRECVERRFRNGSIQNSFCHPMVYTQQHRTMREPEEWAQATHKETLEDIPRDEKRRNL